MLLLGLAGAGFGPAAGARQSAVLLHTDAGDIVVALETARAPITAGNFLHYVDARRLDGTEFYRAMHTAPDAGPDPGRRARSAPAVPADRARADLADRASAMSTARCRCRASPSAPRRGDFTIMVGPQTYLDAGPGSAGDGLGYAVFGHVVEGMDVVRRILAAPTSPTEGEGVMRGQMLDPRIRIITARRLSAR